MSQKQQSTQQEHAITITYFNHSMAQGEKVRLCCLLGGIPFNDNRIRNSEWKDLKGITPHGVLPLLLEDGKEVFNVVEKGQEPFYMQIPFGDLIASWCRFDRNVNDTQRFGERAVSCVLYSNKPREIIE